MADKETNPETQESDAAPVSAATAEFKPGQLPGDPSVLHWLKTHPIESLLFIAIAAVAGLFLRDPGILWDRRELSPVMWMWKVCAKPEFDYKHGHLVPLIHGWLGLVSLAAIEEGEEAD